MPTALRHGSAFGLARIPGQVLRSLAVGERPRSGQDREKREPRSTGSGHETQRQRCRESDCRLCASTTRFSLRWVSPGWVSRSWGSPLQTSTFAHVAASRKGTHPPGKGSRWPRPDGVRRRAAHQRCRPLRRGTPPTPSSCRPSSLRSFPTQTWPPGQGRTVSGAAMRRGTDS